MPLFDDFEEKREKKVKPKNSKKKKSIDNSPSGVSGCDIAMAKKGGAKDTEDITNSTVNNQTIDNDNDSIRETNETTASIDTKKQSVKSKTKDINAKNVKIKEVIDDEPENNKATRELKELSPFHELGNSLLEQFSKNKLHHAIMLSGDYGIGKATFAYWVASQAILSQFNKDNGLYDANLELLCNNTHPDVFFLTLNENKNEIGVDDVRCLLDKLYLKSTYGSKFVVIDDIDFVNINGMNALLKVLEEPPSNTYYFILHHNTTRTLDTICSRCNKINLSITNQDCATVLRELYKDISDDDAVFYTKIAGGSVTFAKMLFDMNIRQYMTIYLSCLSENFSRDGSISSENSGNDKNILNEATEVLNSVYREIDKRYKSLSRILKISLLERVMTYMLNENISAVSVMNTESSNGNRTSDDDMKNGRDINGDVSERLKQIISINPKLVKQFIDIKAFELPVQFV